MNLRRSFKLVAGVLLAVVAGCLADPMQLEVEPIPSATAAVVRPAMGDTFQLRVGEVASIENGVLIVGFRGVRSDSRCPSDVNCVWAGDAEMYIGTTPAGGPWNWSVLHTGVEPMSLRANDLVITVVALDPVPTSGATIPQESYQVSLRVTRAAED